MMKAPFDIEREPESEDTLDLARRELRETPEVKEKALVELKNLLHENTDLYFPENDEFLTIFLRACHYYPTSALKMLRRIAEFKKNNGSLLLNIQPEEEKFAFVDHNIVNVLINRDHKRRRVLIVNCGECWDPKQVSSDQLFRMFYVIHLLAQLEPETQVRGIVVIMDFKGLSMKQIRSLTPQFSMRLLSFIQEAMPLRMKEIHIINQPFLFKMVWAMFKPFIKEKLKNRMWFHGSDMKKLHQQLDPNHLPADYGGNLSKINYSGKEWYPCVHDYDDHIDNWNKYGFANAIN